jgi:hypothetical protein
LKFYFVVLSRLFQTEFLSALKFQMDDIKF